MKAHEVVSKEVSDQAYKLLGLAYLFRNYKSEGIWPDETDAMHGLSILLNGLYRDGQRVAEVARLIDQVDPTEEFSTDRYEFDPIGLLENCLDERRKLKRAEKLASEGREAE